MQRRQLDRSIDSLVARAWKSAVVVRLDRVGHEVAAGNLAPQVKPIGRRYMAADEIQHGH
jgi:hypothetical protein